MIFRLCLVLKIEEGKIGNGWKARKTRIVPHFGSREQLERKERNVGPTPKNLSSLNVDGKFGKQTYLIEKSKTPPNDIVSYLLFTIFFYGIYNPLYFFNSLYGHNFFIYIYILKGIFAAHAI